MGCGAWARPRRAAPSLRDNALAGRRGRRRFFPRPARGIGEITEKACVGREQHSGVVALQAVLVGLHRTVEREEILVLVEGIGKDLVADRIALAANLLRFRCRLRHQYGDFTIGTRADLLRALRTLGAELCCFALPLGLHALIDGLTVLVPQVGAAGAYGTPR